MILSLQTTKKAFLGLCIALCIFAFGTPFASAESYYYVNQSNYSTNQLQSLINQLNVLLAKLQALQGYSNVNYHKYYYTDFTPKQNTYSYNYGSKSYDVEVSTDDADVESDDTAVLSGDVELDDAPYAIVWFDYGTDGDMDEESDSLKLTDDDSFEIEVDDLDEDERYYFRAVAEDPSGYRVYGSIKAFGTDEDDDDDDDNDNDEDTPEATTQDAEDVEEDRAELHGEIEMNDFDDGIAFFVYGEDESAIEDVEDEDTYNDVDEDGDDLQKILLSSNLDDTRTFWTTVSGLDDDTDYFFRICVQYEDEDNDDVLECGSVESFTTDED